MLNSWAAILKLAEKLQFMTIIFHKYRLYQNMSAKLTTPSPHRYFSPSNRRNSGSFFHKASSNRGRTGLLKSFLQWSHLLRMNSITHCTHANKIKLYCNFLVIQLSEGLLGLLSYLRSRYLQSFKSVKGKEKWKRLFLQATLWGFISALRCLSYSLYSTVE